MYLSEFLVVKQAGYMTNFVTSQIFPGEESLRCLMQSLKGNKRDQGERERALRQQASTCLPLTPAHWTGWTGLLACDWQLNGMSLLTTRQLQEWEPSVLSCGDRSQSSWGGMDFGSEWGGKWAGTQWILLWAGNSNKIRWSFEFLDHV